MSLELKKSVHSEKHYQTIDQSLNQLGNFLVLNNKKAKQKHLGRF